MKAVDIDDWDPVADKDDLLKLDLKVQEMLKLSQSPVEDEEEDFSIPFKPQPQRWVVMNLAAKTAIGNQVTIPTHHTGQWYDWRYDEMVMDRKGLAKFKSNFEDRILHKNAPLNRQIPLQIGHGFLGDPRALGWATEMKIKPENGGHTLYTTFDVTDEAIQILERGDYAFVSPSFAENYVEQEIIKGKRAEHGQTLFHVALTNSPVLAELPNVALSKNPMPFDGLGPNFFREVHMTEQTPPAVVVESPPVELPLAPPVADPPADPITPPVAPSEPVSLSQPAPAAPAAPPANGDMVTLSKAEFEAFKLSMETTNRRLEAERIRSHNLTVESISSEAARRGVPPAVLNIIRPILLSSHPESQRTIDLKKGDGTESVNVFEALSRLLKEMPSVSFEQLTPEPAGDRPNSQISTEEAEEEGRKMWASAGIVPDFISKE